jgi:hypothetical protein
MVVVAVVMPVVMGMAMTIGGRCIIIMRMALVVMVMVVVMIVIVVWGAHESRRNPGSVGRAYIEPKPAIQPFGRRSQASPLKRA